MENDPLKAPSPRLATLEDTREICSIYNYYIREAIFTFETETLPDKRMRKRISEILSNGFPWVVAESSNGAVAGYAYAGPWKSRCAYRFSLESTIYLHPEMTGQGIGSILYANLLNRIRQGDYHTVIGGIALPNPASIALHEKFGFKKVAHFPEVGYKFDRWIDVGYWQLKLQRQVNISRES